ncbi:MAG: hypothetical protein Q7R41_15160, partial [Phycisphaerales bacterium]|nr:hypothetical protein [Phycisphaerales bacterium]
APWVLAKGNQARLSVVMYNLAEVLRLIAAAVWPMMPQTAARIATTLGIGLELGGDWTEIIQWGRLKPGVQVEAKPDPLFPRIH